MPSKTKGKLLSAATSLIFGFSFIFTKKGTASVSVLHLLGWRFLLAFLFFELFRRLLHIPIHLKKPGWQNLVILGLLFPVSYFSFESMGIRDTTASEAGVILSMGPIVTMVLSTLFLKERPKKNQFVGILISTFGVVLMVLSKRDQPSFSFYGYAMLLGGVFSYSFYAIRQHLIQSFSVYERTYAMMLIGACVFFLASTVGAFTQGEGTYFLTLPLTNRGFLYSILYLSLLSSNLAFLMSVTSIGILGPTLASSFAGLTTLISVFAGVIFLNETFLFSQWLAAGLIIAGVFLANRR